MQRLPREGPVEEREQHGAEGTEPAASVGAAHPSISEPSTAKIMNIGGHESDRGDPQLLGQRRVILLVRDARPGLWIDDAEDENVDDVRARP